MTKFGQLLVEGLVGGIVLFFMFLTGLGVIVLAPFAAMSSYIADTSDEQSRNVAIVVSWLICTVALHVLYERLKVTKKREK